LFAWIVTADNIAVVRQIQVGPATGDLTIVSSGLNEGDRVVTDGQYKLQANSPVTVSTPPAPVAARSAT
jgi:multidrug efflux system membrane fusion protein